jgi:hypothetical protein
MHIVKKILVGLGGVFLALIALFFWLAVSSSNFRTQQEPFVKAFVTDLSKRWDLTDVYGPLANSFIEQADTAQGRGLMMQLKQLGALQSVRDFELRNYNFAPKGQTGIFSFKGTFDYGEAVVDVTVIRSGGMVRVQGLHVSAPRIREQRTQARSQA